jgi:hypothetical protein
MCHPPYAKSPAIIADTNAPVDGISAASGRAPAAAPWRATYATPKMTMSSTARSFTAVKNVCSALPQRTPK